MNWSPKTTELTLADYVASMARAVSYPASAGRSSTRSGKACARRSMTSIPRRLPAIRRPMSTA